MANKVYPDRNIARRALVTGVEEIPEQIDPTKSVDDQPPADHYEEQSPEEQTVDYTAMVNAMREAADSGRQDSRSNARTPTRFTIRQAHERYTIPKHRIPPGMDMSWKSLTVMGASNAQHMMELFRNGWQPARAADWPEFSGYGMEIPAMVMQLGLMTSVKADDPIVINGLILMQRPVQYSAAARRNERQESMLLVDSTLQRLALDSSRQVGSKLTRVSRTVTSIDD